MIVFDALPPLPRALTESDLRRLGQLLGRSLRFRRKRTVGLRFVAEGEIRRLNRQFRGKDCAIDVLSFATSNLQGYLGDLAICPSYAAREAKRRGVAMTEELARLLVHGTLHLAGYDHASPAEERRMFSLQERVVARAFQV